MSGLPTPPEGVEMKRKRRRLALSCSGCRARRIKCDRNVPNCSSCLARGIQRSCRWGDERDTYNLQRGHQRSDSPEGDVDIVVEKVLKRLQGREQVEAHLAPSRSSLDSASARLPTVQAAANIMNTSAFETNKVQALDGRFSRLAQKQTVADVERVKTSLKALPSRAAVERLLELYLSELEPFRCIFNEVILRQQMAEFWQGVEELHIGGQSLVWPGEEAIPYLEPFYQSKNERSEEEKAPEDLVITGLAKQGLIAVVFALVYATLSSLNYDRKIQLGIFPPSFTEKEVERWTDQFHHISRLHLDLSDYIEHPTIWTLQALVLQTAYFMDRRAIRHSQINVAVLLRLSVSLGLNRLGSAVDDARAMQGRLVKETPSQSIPADQEDEARSNVTSNSFGVTMSSFEEGNLALRELGRKIWTMIVSADFIMGAHMDAHYITHDNINQTSPPSPIDDDEILSAAAPSILLDRNLNAAFSGNLFPGCWHAIARAGRLQVELENTKGSPLPYKDILRVDCEFENAINNLPEDYRYDSSERKGHTLSRQTIIQRNALHEQVQFRLLRLHRLHMGKGFRDVQYLPSLNACFHAAKVIAEARQELEKVVTHSRKMIGYQIHLLHAALVIHLILMFEVDQRKEEMQTGKQRSKDVFRLKSIEDTVEQLQVALHVLRTHASSKEWPKGLDKLEAFLQRIKSDQSIFVPTQNESPRLAAADILASIPSSTFSGDPSTSVNLFDPPLSDGDSSIWSTDLHADLWSLNALFPDYATNSIDLVDALEKVVWS